MTSSTEQEKFQSLAIYAINKKPIGPDVTLSKTNIVPSKGVVTIFIRQRLLGGELVYNAIQLIQRQPSPGCKLEVFLKPVGKDDFKHLSAPRPWRP